MINKFIAKTVVLLSIVILLFNLLFFGDDSFGIIYSLGNLFVVLVCMGLFLYAMHYYIRLPLRTFMKQIFWFSFIFRILSILIVYLILHYIIGGDLSIEEYDTVFYDHYGRLLATFYKTGIANSEYTSFLHNVEFDDKGYIFILSIVYTVFDNVLFAKLIQGLVDSFSVLLICKITSKIYGENIGKTAAILFTIFFPLIVMASLQAKEVYLVFFLLIAIYYTIKLTERRFKFKYLLFVTIALVAIFSMRTILGFIVLASATVYVFANIKYSFIAKTIIPLILFSLIFYSLKDIGSIYDIQDQMKGYFGIDTGDETIVSGRSVKEYENKGQSYAQYATALFVVPQVIITPYPSMVKTNIKEYGTTMQWFFTGGLLIWSFMSFFSFIGIYRSIKFNFKRSSLILYILFAYILVLVVSVYITSTRFNIPKLVLLLIFAAVGLNYEFAARKRYFIIYAVIMSFAIIGWNFIKLSGRGLI